MADWQGVSCFKPSSTRSRLRRRRLFVHFLYIPSLSLSTDEDYDEYNEEKGATYEDRSYCVRGNIRICNILTYGTHRTRFRMLKQYVVF